MRPKIQGLKALIRLPPGQSFTSVSAWRRQHDEISKNLRNGITSTLLLCLYCIATLGNSPDSALLTPHAEIRLPIAGINLPFGTFLTLAPLTLVLFQLYLQRMYSYMLSLNVPVSSNPEETQKLPYLVNQEDIGARVYRLFMLYWLVPLTLSMFAWEAAPRIEGSSLSTLTGAVALILLVLRIRHTSRQSSRRYKNVVRFLLVVILFGFLGLALFGTNPLHRGLDLRNTDLTQMKMDGATLEKLDLAQSLREAQFDWSDMRGVDVSHADLRSSFFYNTQLGGASFQSSDLRDVIFDQ